MRKLIVKTRKPSFAVISKTESRRLALGKQLSTTSEKIKKIDIDLSTISSSKVRNKITKEIQLRNSKTKLGNKVVSLTTKVGILDSRLNYYKTLNW